MFQSQYGFAVVGSDNGHTGASGVRFLDDPDVVKDYSYRSYVRDLDAR